MAIGADKLAAFAKGGGKPSMGGSNGNGGGSPPPKEDAKPKDPKAEAAPILAQSAQEIEAAIESYCPDVSFESDPDEELVGSIQEALAELPDPVKGAIASLKDISIEEASSIAEQAMSGEGPEEIEKFAAFLFFASKV
jgi:hypothetical protein